MKAILIKLEYCLSFVTFYGTFHFYCYLGWLNLLQELFTLIMSVINYMKQRCLLLLELKI